MSIDSDVDNFGIMNHLALFPLQCWGWSNWYIHSCGYSVATSDLSWLCGCVWVCVENENSKNGYGTKCGM